MTETLRGTARANDRAGLIARAREAGLAYFNLYPAERDDLVVELIDPHVDEHLARAPQGQISRAAFASDFAVTYRPTTTADADQQS